MSGGSEARREIVIIGGGIIGCTIAYYLTCHPSFSQETTKITLLEASSIAGGASGKAGGLVAKWAYPKELANISFVEHERLAQAHDGEKRWGWRYCNVGQWVGRGEVVDGPAESKADISLRKKDGLHDGKPKSRKSRIGLPHDLDWVKEDLTEQYEPMAGPKETAQVHPYQFTTSMCELAQQKGAEVVMGKATAITYSDAVVELGKTKSAVVGVQCIDESGATKTIPASTVILAAGPWTPTLMPSLPITGTRAHSITVRPTRPLSAYVLFTEIALPQPGSRTTLANPEIYARPSDEVYACSGGDDVPLPPSTRDVKVDEGYCDALFNQVASISPELRGGEVTVKQACYLPNVHGGPRGCPIVGEMENTHGLFIATGHTCWVRPLYSSWASNRIII